MTFDPAQYAVGDVVKVTRTMRVEYHYSDNSGLRGADVRDGRPVVISASPSSSTTVEMVKRAARPKSKVGDVLTGAEIGNVQWKRGTVIRCVRSSDGQTIHGLSPVVLHLDGRWHDVDGVSPSGYEFDDLNQDAGFEILLVA